MSLHIRRDNSHRFGDVIPYFSSPLMIMSLIAVLLYHFCLLLRIITIPIR